MPRQRLNDAHSFIQTFCLQMDGRPSVQELQQHISLSSNGKVKKLARQLAVNFVCIKNIPARKDRLEIVFKEWIKQLESNSAEVPTRGAMISALKAIKENAIANTYEANIYAYQASKPVD